MENLLLGILLPIVWYSTGLLGSSLGLAHLKRSKPSISLDSEDAIFGFLMALIGPWNLVAVVFDMILAHDLHWQCIFPWNVE